MATFVLVHGAWHGAWCWELVKPRLEALGHRVVASDLPGMGQDTTPRSTLTLELWARFVAGECASQAEPVILVGHSRGGIVISQAAEYAPSSIKRLVYLTAFLVEGGKSMNETRAQNLETSEPIPFIPGPDSESVCVAAEAIQRIFYNTTSDELAARAVSLLVPEPLASLGTPLQLTPEKFGGVPRTYIECLRDQAISIGMQRGMQAALPCDPIITMDTDHSPFYSAPEALAGHLASLA